MGTYTEVEFAFVKTADRAYSADGFDMIAASYEVSTVFGTFPVGFLKNAHSLFVPQALAIIVKAYGRYLALYWSHVNQSPPLPMIENQGYSSPLSSEVREHQDGSARFRGFCSVLSPIDPVIVANISVGFAPTWAVQP